MVSAKGMLYRRLPLYSIAFPPAKGNLDGVVRVRRILDVDSDSSPSRNEDAGENRVRTARVSQDVCGGHQGVAEVIALRVRKADIETSRADVDHRRAPQKV